MVQGRKCSKTFLWISFSVAELLAGPEIMKRFCLNSVGDFHVKKLFHISEDLLTPKIQRDWH